jgi:hypothetical protein
MLRLLRYILFRQVGTSRPDDVKTHLQRYIGYSNLIVSFGLFSVLLSIKLDLPSYVGPNTIDLADLVTLHAKEKLPGLLGGLGRLVSERWFDLTFAGFVMLWFFAYRSAAANEIELLTSFYADDNPPKDWGKIFGGRMTPLVAIGITVAFLMLAWFIDNILLFCAVMLILWTQDAYGNNAVRRNILAHYYGPEFALRPDDPITPRLQARRDVALSYWVWRPHLSRISAMMCCTSLVSAGAVWSKAGGYPVGETVARCGLMAVIAANEAIMVWWRLGRDEALAAIDDAQATAHQPQVT